MTDPDLVDGNGDDTGGRRESRQRLLVGISYNLKKGISSVLPDAEAEYDDPDTIQALQEAIEGAGYSTARYEATEGFFAAVQDHPPDMMFNIAEGLSGRGREAHIPAALSFFGIPFVGSDEVTLALAIDKALTKRVVSTFGVRTPGFRLLLQGDRFSDEGLTYPVIAKPNAEGSSKGLTRQSIVMDTAALQQLVEEKMDAYGQDMLLEEYVDGREFTVGILGNGKDLLVFPPMEIIFLDPANPVYSYEVKQHFEQYVRYACPPDLDAGLIDQMRQMAETVYRALSCRDMARVDFRLSPEGEVFFIELNPLPGLAPQYSDLPIMAAFCGMSYESLIQTILQAAMKRYGLSPLPSPDKTRQEDKPQGDMPLGDVPLGDVPYAGQRGDRDE